MVIAEVPRTPEVVTKKPLAFSWDADDVLLQREKSTRAFGVLAHAGSKFKESITRKKSEKRILSVLPEISHEIVDSPITKKTEIFSYNRHAGRQVYPHVAETLGELKLAGADHFLNTGRSNKKDWVAMTDKSLEDGNIAYLFEPEKFFTPEGMKTAESKADAIRKLQKGYERVIHVEDDPRTAAYLAEQFKGKDLTIYLVHYGSAGLLYSRKELQKYPNIKRIEMVQEIAEDFKQAA